MQMLTNTDFHSKILIGWKHCPGHMVWQSEVSPEWLRGVGVWGCFAETPLRRLWHYMSPDSVLKNTNGLRFPDARRQGCIRLTIFSHSVANGQFMSARLKKMSLNSEVKFCRKEELTFKTKISMSELREIGCNKCSAAVDGGQPKSKILYNSSL